MKVSIALATFNGARFLKEQLASLLGQALLPSELVVGDDASTDDTARVIAEFAAVAPFPVLFHCNPERLGYRKNFMRCAERCSGDLIAFCDQDDVWLPHKLATQVLHFENPRVQLSCHPVRLMSADGTIGTRIFDMIGKEGLFRLTELQPFAFTTGLTQIFRRGLLKHEHLWPSSIDPDRPHEKAAHDQWFFFLAAVMDGVVHVAEPLALYRQHEANAFGAPKPDPSKLRIDAEFVHGQERRYRSWVAGCQNRIECLQMIDTPNTQAWASEAGRHYHHALAVLEGRLAFYRATGTGRRAAALAANVVHGHYAPFGHPWSLGARSAVKDFAIVVLTPRISSTPTAP